MPALLLAWALLLALARAAPLFQAEQAVLTAPSHLIDTASTITPRPDRTAYFDPRAGGGAQYNVSDSIYRSGPLVRRSQQAYHSPLLCVLIKHVQIRLVAISPQRNLWDGHEPLNIIISAQSSADVLKESGFIAYSRSLGAGFFSLSFFSGLSRLIPTLASCCQVCGTSAPIYISATRRKQISEMAKVRLFLPPTS